MSTPRSRLFIATAVGLAVSAPASTASAATLAKTGSNPSRVITYDAAAGETNQLAVSHASGTYTFTSIAGAFTSVTGVGCTVDGGDPTIATCTSGDTARIDLNLGDQADLVAVNTGQDPFVVNGGDGNDNLAGGAANDTINGDNGSDRMAGGDGNDFLFGGSDAGNDVMRGGLGADWFDVDSGGNQLTDPGIDRVEYNSDGRVTGVTVIINSGTGSSDDDGSSVDGSNNNRDYVGTSIESITATDFADTLTGSALDNTLAGIGGNDTINGGAGNDFMGGGVGADVMRGGIGADRVTYSANAGYPTSAGVTVTLDGIANDGVAGENDNVGNSMHDIEYLFGSDGPDVIDLSGFDGMGGADGVFIAGNAGDDVLTGSAGNDSLDGGLGTDTLNCGLGTDLFLNGETLNGCP